MNGWPVHSDSNGFPSDGTFDPSMLNNTSNPQFQNPQFQQPRAQTPSQFPYTPQQLVPSKRPRDDGAVNSPRQPPSNLSLSRSQTPQQVNVNNNNNFQGGTFPNNQQGQALQNSFPHLHGSNNATPSPTLSNQQYRPPGQQQQSGMGMSPPPDGSGRGTPQNPSHPQFNMNGQMGGQMPGAQMGMGPMPGQNFNMPGTSMPQGFNQNFAAMQNMGGQGGQYGVQLTANLAQRQAAIQQMSMERQRQIAQQRQAHMNPLMQQAAANQPIMATPTRPQGNMQNPQNPQRQAEERAFMEKVAKYMQHAQQAFDPHPTIAGRPVNLFHLFQFIIRAGSSKRVTQTNQWPMVARNLGLPPEQIPNAGLELQQLFQRTLGPWEAAYYNNQQQRMAQLKQQAQMGGMAPGQQGMSPGRPIPQSNNQATNQAYMQQLQSRMAGMQPQQGPAAGQMTPQQSNASLPIANGFSTPQSEPAAARAPSVVDQHRKSASRQLEGSPAQTKAGTFATPPPVKPLARTESKDLNGVAAIQPEIDSTNYTPGVRNMLTPLSYGGIDVDNVFKTLTRPAALHDFDIPGIRDLGILDLQALTLSLQSGILAEVRYALDILVKLTDMHHIQVYMDLPECGDLLDVLVDCGEDQVEFLSDKSKRIEGLEHGSYEELARLAKLEIHEVQDIAEPGSKKYDRERAAERLIAITSILRNLSFPRHIHNLQKDNTHYMATSRAVKFLSSTIGLLATRVISLQSSLNTQDFMKDVIIFLSNTAAHIVLESQDDAYNFLQFILAFAPGPIPTETNPFRFASYRPSVHKYYPAAIDAFAKLLARDDPNRTFFKQIFVDVTDHEDAEDSDLPVHQQYDLLTRAFGMAIAVIPDVSGHERKPLNRMDDEILAIASARKPSLSQGMLTADILSMLIPTSDPSLAKSWLRSQDSWGSVLFRVISELAEHDGAREVVFKNQHGSHFPAHLHRDEGFLQTVFVSIVSRAMSMLKRLAKKALEDVTQPTQQKPKEDIEDGKANGVDHADSEHEDEDTSKANEEILLENLADLEKSPAADFLPLSDSIFYGIFANTKELASGVIADYIALGEILH
jgi:SWI/SNF chromatin-remodeling complex subunit SWI1